MPAEQWADICSFKMLLFPGTNLCGRQGKVVNLSLKCFKLCCNAAEKQAYFPACRHSVGVLPNVSKKVLAK